MGMDLTKRSPREQRMATYVAEAPNPTNELTPDDEAVRIARNWRELKLARINALKQRNQKGVGILDKELAEGRGKDFPHGAEFDEDSDLGPLAAGGDDDLGPLKQTGGARPARGRPSQSDVRKSEPTMALIEQEAAERSWDQANRDFTAKGGVLKPGQTQAQAVTEATGQRDPAETRQGAEAQHAIDTGELQYGDSLAYNLAKPAAAVVGFSGAVPGFSGPLGASGAEALVRATAIGYNLNAALDKGLDPDRAAQMFIKEMSNGVALDALFNIGGPVIGAAIMKIPGLNRIADKLHAELQKRLGSMPAKPELRDARIKDLQKETADPNRAKAVEELSNHVEGDYIPTKGQVAGKSGVTERVIAKSFPTPFEEQEAALRAGAEKMRAETLSPLSQSPGQPALRPDAKVIGERIDQLADQTIKAVKDRLRPVFKLANEQGVHSDFTPVAGVARRALRHSDKLSTAERAHLQSIVDDAIQNPLKTAESALDFASAQKAMSRQLNQNGESTPFYKITLDSMIREADDSFTRAMEGAGKGRIKNLLNAARTDYREMNQLAYDGAIKQILKKSDNAPEDIAKFLWQNGKVTRIEQLDELLALARREGVTGSATTSKLRRDVTRSFLQKGVQDVESAANWSKKLADPDRAATWAVLTQGADGKALKEGMAVLEQAAQIATMRDTTKATPFLGIGLSRAAGGGLGISWVTGAFSPWLAGAGLSIAGTMRLMATAYVHGDKGTINLLSKVLRANSTATAASAKAMQTLVPELSKMAEKYDVKDLFMKDEQSDQQSDQQLGPR